MEIDEMQAAVCTGNIEGAPEAPEKPESIPLAEYERLAAELGELRRELERKERLEREAALWQELYPGLEPGDIPQAVADEAERLHIPAAAAYAMYERRGCLADERARLMNESNRGRSTGALGGDGGGELTFSLEEIRSMTPAQVKRHYRQIIKSLGGGR